MIGCPRKSKLVEKIQVKKTGIIREILKWVRGWQNWDTSSLMGWGAMICEAAQKLLLGLNFLIFMLITLVPKVEMLMKSAEPEGGFQH